MTELIALAAALCWGVSDFVGALASRRNGYSSAGITTRVGALVTALVLVPFFDLHMRATDLAWGAAAGVAAAIALHALFHAMQIGNVSVVTGISASGTACGPVLFGLIAGEKPSVASLVGIATAIVAIWLISAKSAVHLDVVLAHKASLRSAFLSAAGFACVFVFLDNVEGAGISPIVVMHATGLAALVVYTKLRSLPLVAGSWKPGLAAGILTTAGAASFLWATNHGLLSIVSTLASLYPAATVLLARIFLKEKWTRHQILGFGFALTAIMLLNI